MIDFRGRCYRCPMEITLDLIGGKWKALILWHLGQESAVRYGVLGRMHPQLTQKMLTQQLRELESDGLIHRKVYLQVPPKVEYSLTDYGRALEPILDSMTAWGQDYVIRETTISKL